MEEGSTKQFIFSVDENCSSDCDRLILITTVRYASDKLSKRDVRIFINKR